MWMKSCDIHLVSDATGETIRSVLRACLAQFPSVDVHQHFWNLIQNQEKLQEIKGVIKNNPGPVFYTLVNPALEKDLISFCRENNLFCLSILEPVLQNLSSILNVPFERLPGKQHDLSDNYFSRISAIDYSLALDDGNKPEKWNEAEIVILGVSRTTKTPTSLYLANFGYKTANIPLIPALDPPKELFNLDKALIVGLTIDPDLLAEVRQTRIKYLNIDKGADYANPEKIREELQMARRLFAKLDCPVINITNKSIEETAAEIVSLMNKREIEKDAHV
jgi:regulator of PEP synthase PpsR (kinase-PPPase family)